MMLTLHVKQGKCVHQVTVKQDAKMSEVMQTIEQVTEVPVRQRKLICQGKVLDSNSTVEALNLKQGSKLMLVTAGGQTQVRQIPLLILSTAAIPSSLVLRRACTFAGPRCCAKSYQGESCCSTAASRGVQAEARQERQGCSSYGCAGMRQQSSQWLAGSYFCQGDGSPSDFQTHTCTHTFINILILIIILDMIAIIGTSDQPCWLAEACKILLLLLSAGKAGCPQTAANLQALAAYNQRLFCVRTELRAGLRWALHHCVMSG